MLADVFENFRNMCLEILELDPAKFLPACKLACKTVSKKVKVKSDFLPDTDTIRIVDKSARGGICHSIYQDAKVNNK